MMRMLGKARSVEITKESAASVNVVELRSLRSIDVVQLDPDALKYDEVRRALADSKAMFVTKTARSIDELVDLFEEKNIEFIHTHVLLSDEPDAIRNVFGAKSRATQAQVESALETFKHVPGVRVASKASDTSSIADEMVRKLETAKKGEFFLIVGHNDGGVVRCPDQSSLRIDDIQAAIARSDGNGLLLTCESIKHSGVLESVVITRDLEVETLASGIARLARVARLDDQGKWNGPCNSLMTVIEQLQGEFDHVVKGRRRGAKIALSVVAAGKFVVVVYYVLDDRPASSDTEPTTKPTDK